MSVTGYNQGNPPSIPTHLSKIRLNVISSHFGLHVAKYFPIKKYVT